MIVNELETNMYPYTLKKITENNIETVYHLIKKNTYYDAFSETETTLESCLQDIKNVPLKISLDHKFYYGIYDKDEMIALIDFILEYPTPQTIYLGFFITSYQIQKQGLGSLLMRAFIETMREKGYKFIELGCYNENEKGIHFWHKLGFKDIGINTDQHLDIQKMQYDLNKINEGV